jgi:putative transcriptional regulator
MTTAELQRMREGKGLSQRDIAKAIGIAKGTYINIEHNRRKPSVEVAKKIATVLDFDWWKIYE